MAAALICLKNGRVTAVASRCPTTGRGPSDIRTRLGCTLGSDCWRENLRENWSSTQPLANMQTLSLSTCLSGPQMGDPNDDADAIYND
jgi:hypothetical protein